MEGSISAAHHERQRGHDQWQAAHVPCPAAAQSDADAVKASVIQGQNLSKADVEKGTKNDSMLADNSIYTYTGTDGALYVNDFKVIGDPITTDNGTVYVVDGVIQPK